MVAPEVLGGCLWLPRVMKGTRHESTVMALVCEVTLGKVQFRSEI